MKKHRRVIVASAIYLLISACSPVDSVHPFDEEQARILIKNRLSPKPTQEMITLKLPREQRWKQVDIAADNTLSQPVVLIPEYENLSNWTERVQTKISGYVYKPDMTAQKFVQNEIDNAYRHCRQVNPKILTQTPQYVTYRLDVYGCQNERNQMKIGKALNGADAVYMVRYSALTGQVSSTQFTKMSHSIEGAILVINPRYKK